MKGGSQRFKDEEWLSGSQRFMDVGWRSAKGAYEGKENPENKGSLSISLDGLSLTREIHRISAIRG